MTSERSWKERCDHERYDEIFVSPHLDDAVYSCAGRISKAVAHGRRVLVITVFGHGDEEAPSMEGARFGDYRRREREDEEAMAALGADSLWLNRPELIFRSDRLSERVRYLLPWAHLGTEGEAETLERELSAVFGRYASPSATIHFPLSAGFHPDHRLVSDTGLTLAKRSRSGQTFLFYEDIPYALVRPLLTYRLWLLGLPVRFEPLTDAWAVSAFIGAGLARLLVWPAMLLYLGFVRFVGSFFRRSRSLPELLSQAEEVGLHLRAKVRAMHLYSTQTPLFFDPGVPLERQLGSRGRSYVERSWRIGP